MLHLDPKKLDRVIHSPVRLAILSALAASDEVEFGFLKRSLAITDGNLSSHLSRLEEKGYIRIRKIFRGKRPCTLLSITREGRDAFTAYLTMMERVIRQNEEPEGR